MTTMKTYEHIVQCIDLQEEDIQGAIVSRDETWRLLQHLARVSAPMTGAPKALLLISRIGTTACDWLEGDLVIEIVGDEDACVVEIMTELGAGMRERTFPSLGFLASRAEFETSIERFPAVIHPLEVTNRERRRITLRVVAEQRRSTRPPPPIRLSERAFLGSTPSVLVKSAPAKGEDVVSTKRKPINELDDLNALDDGWDDS